jgi:hypothetical protein
VDSKTPFLRTKKYWPEIAVLTNVKQLPELTGLKSKTKFLVSEKLLFNHYCPTKLK